MRTIDAAFGISMALHAAIALLAFEAGMETIPPPAASTVLQARLLPTPQTPPPPATARAPKVTAARPPKSPEYPLPRPAPPPLATAKSTAPPLPAPPTGGDLAPAQLAAALPSPPASAETSDTPEAAQAVAARPSSPAAYLDNPKPEYPRFARKRGLEGQVVLGVRVSPDGAALSVTVLESSGHAVLDEAAHKAVEKWRFVPASRDGQSVEASVNVPVRFALADG